MAENTADQRYIRQAIFFPNGAADQERLTRSHALLVGCGALGTHAAEELVRAGVGSLTLVDRDVVEWSNLHRQIGFGEGDATARRLKVEALTDHLRNVNSSVELRPHAVDFNHQNARDLAAGCDLLLDGSDNIPTRFLMNDLSYATGVPWIYAGAVGDSAHVQFFAGDSGPCLRCVLPDLPAPGTLATCDTGGIVGSTAALAAAWQTALAIRYLTEGDRERLAGTAARLSAWKLAARTVEVTSDPNCPVCGPTSRPREFSYLSGAGYEPSVALCGRDAVQVLPAAPRDSDGEAGEPFDLEAAALQLEPLGDVLRRGQFLRFQGDDFVMTLFRDGRALFDGVKDVTRARSLYARLVGR